MPRLCTCEGVDRRRPCWLYRNDERYKALCDGRAVTEVKAVFPGEGGATSPLCKYEGAVIEFAPCNCEGRHIRRCENPNQGIGEIPDIDLCIRDYSPSLTVQSCQRCKYLVPLSFGDAE